MKAFSEVVYEYPPKQTQDQVMAEMKVMNPDLTDEQIRNEYTRSCEGAQYFANDKYLVSIRPFFASIGEDDEEAVEMAHVSIRRHDRKVHISWEDKQTIKTQLLGVDVEAVELFPASKRNFATSGQTMLWALPPDQKWPFGFEEGMGFELIVDKPPGPPIEMRDIESTVPNKEAMEEAFKKAQTDMQKAKDAATEEQKKVFEQGKIDYVAQEYKCPYESGEETNLWVLGQRAAAIEYVTDLQEVAKGEDRERTPLRPE